MDPDEVQPAELGVGDQQLLVFQTMSNHMVAQVSRPSDPSVEEERLRSAETH